MRDVSFSRGNYHPSYHWVLMKFLKIFGWDILHHSLCHGYGTVHFFPGGC